MQPLGLQGRAFRNQVSAFIFYLKGDDSRSFLTTHMVQTWNAKDVYMGHDFKPFWVPPDHMDERGKHARQGCINAKDLHDIAPLKTERTASIGATSPNRSASNGATMFKRKESFKIGSN